MNSLKMLFFFALVLSLTDVGAISKRDPERLKELDEACEVARERKLAPLRQEYIEECVAKKQKKDRAHCERFYSDYGIKTGDRAELFYDLPECVEAFEFRKTHRRR